MDKDVRRKAKATGMMPHIALSLYAYNVPPFERAQRLYDHFEGHSMEVEELAWILANQGEFAATELPYETAKAYVAHALTTYGQEALQRALANEETET